MKKWLKKSLFAKLMALLGLFVLIPSLAFFIYANNRVTQLITVQVKEKLLAVTHEKQAKLSSELDNLEKLARTYAQDDYANEYFNHLRKGGRVRPEAVQKISARLEKEVQKGQGLFENMMYYYEGTIIADGMGGKGIGQTSDILVDQINLIKPSPITGAPVMVNRIVYYKDSQRANTFVMAVALNNVTKKIIAGDQSEIKAVVLDATGLVIASDNAEEIMKVNYAEAGGETTTFFQNMGKNESGIDFLVMEGQRYLAAYSKDTKHNLYVVAYIPISAYTDINQSLIQRVILGLILFIAVCLALSYNFSKKFVIQPIEAIASAIRKMAQGDFSTEVMVKSEDEIGVMASELNKMGENLSELIGRAVETAEKVNQGSNEITNGNRDLSQRTQEQASTLEEIASTVEEVSASIRQTAANSEQADQISQTTLSAVQEGEKAVEQTMEAMKEITVSSQQIADIIKVVNDIAFQTNLLALNAAVEAARAGEQGRGFAVVAAEVRNLAGRTAESSKEIEKLIKESVNRVQNGNATVQRAGEMLKQIVINTKHTSDVVVEIAAAVKEQASAAGQIQNAIEQLNQVTQQNAAMVQEIAASSETLNMGAESLAETVAVFKVKGEKRGIQRKTVSTRQSNGYGFRPSVSSDKVQLSQGFEEDNLDEF